MATPIRPEDVLPDGSIRQPSPITARKGTVAAFVANAKLLEELPAGTAERDAVVIQLRLLIPGLRAVGALDVFTPRSPTIAALVQEQMTTPSE